MPTGYTADIAKGISFEQYAWTCARAFGALIMMRDDPSDARVPEEFQASTYNLEALRRAEVRRDELRDMTQDQIRDAADAAFRESHAAWERRRTERSELRCKYYDMLTKVRAWRAPSDDHREYKRFMEEQILQSIDFDCSSKYDTEPTPQDPMAWHRQQQEKAQRDIEYHRAEHEKELERTAGRNRWVAQLRESIGPQPVGSP